ncbi:MAG: Uma2 family endonuclease [Oscillatoriaceae cyanobacterium Prado104]|jgi:Uma2 family endonuclease|nr:Uma2 family endonuclease [Oscillatoriaceae cyanobacterium Prado104]
MTALIQNQTENSTDNLLETPADKKIWTDAEFMALDRDGHRYELVNGELIDMGNSGAKHGYICSILMILLGGYVRLQNLGAMFDSSTAFKMKSGNKRSPDISFMAKERLQGLDEMPDGFLEGAPDLAVEILSPSNTVEEIDSKLVEYFENGAHLVWVIQPKQKYILVYRSAEEPDRLLKSVDSLDGEEIVPGFTLPVADLFQKLNFS